MTRSRHATSSLCASCRKPVRDVTICTACQAGLERDLGDVAAFAQDALRVFTADDRDRGEVGDPLVRSRARRLVAKVDPVTGGHVLVPEPYRPGEFGRSPSSRWDAEHGLGHEIVATVARQTATAAREGGRSASKPLPFNDHAALAAAAVHATLSTWVRDLHDGAEDWPRDDVVAFAAWLLSRTDRIARHPAADEIDRDVRNAVAALRRAVDRPADRWFMGPCDTDGCVQTHVLVDDDGSTRSVSRPTELYAEPTATVVRCRACRAEYPIEDRRAWLLAVAEDQLAHAELIGRAAPALGVEITPAAVRGYAARGRIAPHGVDVHGRPLYRVGDVITVARDVLAQRADRATKAADDRAEKAAKEARRADAKRSA